MADTTIAVGLTAITCSGLLLSLTSATTIAYFRSRQARRWIIKSIQRVQLECDTARVSAHGLERRQRHIRAKQVKLTKIPLFRFTVGQVELLITEWICWTGALLGLSQCSSDLGFVPGACSIYVAIAMFGIIAENSRQIWPLLDLDIRDLTEAMASIARKFGSVTRGALDFSVTGFALVNATCLTAPPESVCQMAERMALISAGLSILDARLSDALVRQSEANTSWTVRLAKAMQDDCVTIIYDLRNECDAPSAVVDSLEAPQHAQTSKGYCSATCEQAGLDRQREAERQRKLKDIRSRLRPLQLSLKALQPAVMRSRGRRATKMALLDTTVAGLVVMQDIQAIMNESKVQVTVTRERIGVESSSTTKDQRQAGDLNDAEPAKHRAEEGDCAHSDAAAGSKAVDVGDVLPDETALTLEDRLPVLIMTTSEEELKANLLAATADHASRANSIGSTAELSVPAEDSDDNWEIIESGALEQDM